MTLPRMLTSLRIPVVIHCIRTVPKVKTDIRGHKLYLKQKMCSRCYSLESLGCGGATLVRKKQGYLSSNRCPSSPLTLNSKNNIIFNKGICRMNTRMRSVCKQQMRQFKSGVWYQHLLDRNCSSGVLSCTNQSIWNYTERRGMKSGRDKAGQSQDEFINPIDRLQQFILVPLLEEKDYIFKPSPQEVSKAQELFVPNSKHKIEFLKSALFEDNLPDYDLPEVAFIGRSNVGKSSLIRMLLSQADVSVRISGNPGHTRTLNFFQVGQKFTLVDMPGYGYNMPKHYASSVEAFLHSRKKLTRSFILIDSTVGVTEHDVTGLNMLEEFKIPYVMTFLLWDGYGPNSVDEARFEMIKAMNSKFCVVMTKIDKTKPAILMRSFKTVLQYREAAAQCFQQPFLVSSLNGEGVPLLQTFIAYVTGNISIKGL